MIYKSEVIINVATNESIFESSGQVDTEPTSGQVDLG